MAFYRCDTCGCYLDPGEGRICEECRAKNRRKGKQEPPEFIDETGDERYLYEPV